MFFQVIIVLSLILACAIADKHLPPRPPSYHGPPPPHHAPPHYDYAYAVKAESTKPFYAPLDYGQTESRDGYKTHGAYHVLLPDGRVQTVTYTVADDQSGFVADVKYSGTPHYGPPAHQHPHGNSAPRQGRISPQFPSPSPPPFRQGRITPQFPSPSPRPQTSPTPRQGPSPSTPRPQLSPAPRQGRISQFPSPSSRPQARPGTRPQGSSSQPLGPSSPALI